MILFDPFGRVSRSILHAQYESELDEFISRLERKHFAQIEQEYSEYLEREFEADFMRRFYESIGFDPVSMGM